MKSLTKGEFSFIRSGYPVSFKRLGTRSVETPQATGVRAQILIAFGAKTDRQRPSRLRLLTAARASATPERGKL